VRTLVLSVNQSEVMSFPGANRSTQDPELENEARMSLLSVAPTVMAVETRDGENWHASLPLLPAATT